LLAGRGGAQLDCRGGGKVPLADLSELGGGVAFGAVPQ
jgi:hypothetical protein